jgi:mono/diheme cytochrome c family protein
MLTACGSQQIAIPDGNPVSGKVAFSDHKCFACHQVEGGGFPVPTTITPTYVDFGSRRIGSREYLMESIIAPSHRFAKPIPPPGKSAGDENVMSGSKSRMSNYSDQLTVREMLDLIAYLEQLQEGA